MSGRRWTLEEIRLLEEEKLVQEEETKLAEIINYKNPLETSFQDTDLPTENVNGTNHPSESTPTNVVNTSETKLDKETPLQSSASSTSSLEYNDKVVPMQESNKVKEDTALQRVPTKGSGQRIILDIGGVHYSTTAFTLEKYPESLFGSIINKEWQDETVRTLFIDRDPTHFRYIVNFLRDGAVDMPDDLPTRKELLREAKFYNLTTMADIIEKNLHIFETKKETKNQSEPLKPMDSKDPRVGSLVRKTKGNVDELIKMLDYSHKLREALESEIDEVREVLKEQQKETTDYTRKMEQDIVELQLQLDQRIKNERKILSQKNKMGEEMKKIEEEIATLRDVIAKQKAQLQADGNAVTEEVEEEKKVFEKQKRHLESELQDLNDLLGEKDQVILKQKQAFEAEVKDLKKQLEEAVKK